MSQESTRYGQRTKKRKTNLILNSLIGIVVLLIIVVSANIFLGNNEEKVASEETTEMEKNAPNEEDKDGVATENENEEPSSNEKDEEESTVEEKKEEETMKESKSNKNEDESTEEKENADSIETETTEQEEAQVTQGGSSPNVIRTIVNPAWKPVGTVQEGEHYNVYDGVDWDEMVKAISYATGLSQDNMTIKFLGNNGPNKSVGTVYSKNKEDIYRVYIEWVDNEGWKPTLVEELAEIE